MFQIQSLYHAHRKTCIFLKSICTNTHESCLLTWKNSAVVIAKHLSNQKPVLHRLDKTLHIKVFFSVEWNCISICILFCAPCGTTDINQTVRIVLYCVIFLLSVLGNSLIITVLVRNRRMRTVTNLFLLSLSVSDLMLCVICMPFTLIPNLMKNFVFGSGICKVATYFMGEYSGLM